MARLIDADSLFKTIEQNDYYVMSPENNVDKGMFTIGIKQAIDEQPTIDAAPVTHGHWITRNERNPMFLYGECSICKFEQSISHFLNYCPNCGARMDEVIE